MKVAFVIAGIFLLSFLSSCTHMQRVGNAHENKEPSEKSQSQVSPNPTGRGTPAEAKALLQKAVDHYNSVGRKQAFADFTGKKAPFIDRDLYVVCIGPDRVVVANGGFPQYVGASSDILKDANGKPLGRTIWEIGNSKGDGSVEYRWLNPVTGQTERKITFVRKVGEDVCGVGAYNPE